MSKLKERISPIQRQRVGTKFKTALHRRGNIARGQGTAPVTMSRALIKRETGLKRKGPTARAITHEGEYGERLAAGTEMDWQKKLFETILEKAGDDPEGEEAWKDFWKDKEAEGDKPKRGNKATNKFTKRTYRQQRGK